MSGTSMDQKQARFRKFLQRLSEDAESHRGTAKPSRPLSELLLFAGFTPGSESIDMARLVTKLLQMRGVEGCSEQMIEHVLNGGTVEEFLRQSQASD